MKQKITYEKMNYQYVQLFILSLLLSPTVSYASPTERIGFPISGSACQAYDEAALSSGELIRTTFGVHNKSTKNINLYCPVKVERDSSQHYISLSFTGGKSRSSPECYLAFNAYQLRQYKRLEVRGSGYLGAVIDTKRFGEHPVTIKCTLQPDQAIVHISSLRNKKVK